jgi:hypothetical protein
MQPIVTPERWYIAFWIVMGVGYAVLNAALVFVAVFLAIKWTK